MPSRRPLPVALLADVLGRLATALGAGIDVRRAWTSETARVPAGWRASFAAVGAALDRGQPLGEALAAAGAAFPPLVCGMVAVGDQTGHEPEILRDLSAQMRSLLRARRAIRRSLATPAFQLAVAILVVGILIGIAGFLRDGAGRPIDLVGSGLAGPGGLAWYAAGLVAIAGGLVAAARIGCVLWRSGGGRVRRLVAIVPVVGPVLQAGEALAWCRAAALASGAGLGAGRLMELTATVAPALACDPGEVEAALRGGATLADVLHASGRFPRRLVEAVDVGELTGTTAEVLGRMADDFDDEFQRGIAAAGRAAGFFAQAVVAAIVALVVFRIFSSYVGMIQDAAGGRP